MTQRFYRIQRRVWTHAPDTGRAAAAAGGPTRARGARASDVQRRRCRQADSLPPRPNADASVASPRSPCRPLAPTRVGAAAHNVDGNTATPLLPATTSRRATPPSTLWTAACALSAAQIGTRVSDDRNNTGSEIWIPRGAPTSLATTQRKPVQSTLLALLAMGKCNCRCSRRVLDVRHATLPRPPPALPNALRTE
jgi:hypothetical protein